MDDEDQNQLPPGVDKSHVDNALRAIQERKPIPEIDFTLHTMEDGSQVSTMERVCKGSLPLFNPANRRPSFDVKYLKLEHRCPSSSNVSTD